MPISISTYWHKICTYIDIIIFIAQLKVVINSCFVDVRHHRHIRNPFFSITILHFASVTWNTKKKQFKILLYITIAASYLNFFCHNIQTYDLLYLQVGKERTFFSSFCSRGLDITKFPKRIMLSELNH